MVLVTLGFVVVGDSKEVRRLALAEDAQSVLP
jgi:hypothetical protein